MIDISGLPLFEKVGHKTVEFVSFASSVVFVVFVRSESLAGAPPTATGPRGARSAGIVPAAGTWPAAAGAGLEAEAFGTGGTLEGSSASSVAGMASLAAAPRDRPASLVVFVASSTLDALEVERGGATVVAFTETFSVALATLGGAGGGSLAVALEVSEAVVLLVLAVVGDGCARVDVALEALEAVVVLVLAVAGED